ncbi:MAG: MFS transporter [Azospirillaceae bacterium]
MTVSSRPAAVVDHAGAVKVVLLLASSLTVMSGATISPSLPALREHFIDVERVDLMVRLVLTLPALFIALCSMAAGAVIDRFGRRRMILAATALYAVAGSAGLYIESIGALMASRALLGVAVAGVMTTASTLAGDYFAGPERERFLGFQASFMAFGGVVFLIAGGALADWHWRGPFGVYGLALLLLPAMAILLSEPARAGRASPGDHASDDATQGAAWQDTDDRAVPTGLMALLYGLAVLHMILFYALPVQLPFFLGELELGGPAASGAALASATLVAATVSLFFRVLRRFMNHRAIFALSFGALGAGLVILSLADAYPMVLLAMVVSGFGLGALMPNYMVILMARAPERVRGRAVGGLTTAIFLGQFVSPLITQPLAGALGLAGGFAATGALSVAIGAVFVWLSLRGRSLVRG